MLVPKRNRSEEDDAAGKKADVDLLPNNVKAGVYLQIRS